MLLKACTQLNVREYTLILRSEVELLTFSDLEIGHKCAENCYQVLDKCQQVCGETDFSCLVQCDTDLVNCITPCPCQSGCPLGCDQCLETSFCQCHRDQSVDKINCEDEANQNYFDCVIGCGGDAECIGMCARDNDQNLSNCPCNELCPNGCPCPNWQCPITTTVATTTTTAAPTTNITALILNTAKPYNSAVITNIYGREDRSFGFVFEPETQVSYSCSLTFNGRAYIYGSRESDQKQISVLEKCSLKRIGTLPFSFVYGACTSTHDSIYLCFQDHTDKKSCRKGTDPMGPFDTIQKSSYDHGDIRLAASGSKFQAEYSISNPL